MNAGSVRYAAGAALAVCVFALSWAVLDRLEGGHDLIRALSGRHLAAFYAGVALSYLLVFGLWRSFSELTGSRRAASDAFVDTGLLALAKYVPGKIWGVVMRGAVSGQRVSLSRRNVWRSLSEQLATLVFGVVVFGCILLSASTASSTLALLGCAALFATGYAVLTRLMRAGGATACPTLRVGLLGIGYCLLWLVSVMPFLVIVTHRSTPIEAELMPIAAAFIVSSIAGWVAVIAPAGFGVREAVFAFVHPSQAAVQEGLGWIVLHRALFTVFDLVFGAAAVAVLCARKVLARR